MLAKSIHATSFKEFKYKLEGLFSDDFKPTLAIVFNAISYDIKQISQLFTIHNIDLVGCTTAGEIENVNIYDNGIVALVLDVNKDYYQIGLSDSKMTTTTLSGKYIAQFALDSFSNPAMIILSGGVGVNADCILEGINETLDGREIPTFGGLAGDDFNLDATYVYSNTTILNNGLLSLVFDNEKIEVSGLATSGWEAIGDYHTISEAEGNIVYSINDEPALDVFIKYFGYYDNADVKGKPISTISAQYPLQVLRADGSSVLRTPLSSKDKSLILAGGVKEGDKFRFSISPGFEVIDQTIEEFEDFHLSSKDADALILFSCKGRHAALGPLIEDEVEGIYKQWNKPMIGFFSYGEIGKTKDAKCDFHNETCALVVLKEK